MVANFDIATPHALSETTQKIVNDFEQLGIDDKLAVLYWAYEKMGDSITPAAPTSADPRIAPILLDDFYKLSGEDQLAVMRDIASQKDTEYSRAYGALTANNQLVVWCAWAIDMGDRVIDIPNDYEANEASKNVLNQLEQLEFQDQISVLRQIAIDMGYNPVQGTPTQAETGKTPSL